MVATISSVRKLEAGANYVIRLEVFEGPLDLLLRLIEREELEITAVSIAQVTDQFLAHLEQAAGVPTALLADFITMAARLLQIKSRALLPSLEPTSEEEEDDPGEVLARQLRLYKQFRQVAHLLTQRERKHLRAYVRVTAPPRMEDRLEPGQIRLEDLVTALKRVLEEKKPPVEATVVTPYTVTIQDKMIELRQQLQRHRRLDFTEILRNSRHRQEVIVSFMAVLELVKQGEIQIRQEVVFGPIVIERVSSLPNDVDGEASMRPAQTPSS